MGLGSIDIDFMVVMVVDKVFVGGLLYILVIGWWVSFGNVYFVKFLIKLMGEVMICVVKLVAGFELIIAGAVMVLGVIYMVGTKLDVCV